VEGRELLRDAFSHSEEGWVLLRYLKKLKQNDPAFDYRVAEDSDTGAPVAVVWQTGSMRAHLENFGDVLFLDTMKKKRTQLLGLT